MKKDRLYTVNRWNRPAFMPQDNIFANGGVKPTNWLGISKEDNPFSKMNIKDTLGSMAGVIGGTVGQIGGGLISGGLQSGAGSTISSVGNTIGSAISTVNPLIGGIVSAGSGLLGGLTSRAFGSKMNKENIADVENNISGMRSSANSLASTGSSSQLLNSFGNIDTGYDFGNGYIGKDGWFSNKAKKKANTLRNQQNIARGFVTHALTTAAQGVDQATDDAVMSTFAAFGGPLEMMANSDDVGAIGYGLMSDYLNMKNNQAQGKNNVTSYLGNMPSEPMTFAKGGKIHINPKNKGKLTETARRTGKSFSELAHSKNPLTRKRAQFALNARHWNHKHGYGGLLDNDDTLFALGGDMQANGGDFSDGLTLVNAGQQHEQNPYEGVQMGIAPDGSPNLVEEGETIFNDYVFSDRIKPSKDVLKKFHMYSKGGKLTYADVSKRLEKEAKERPNDPVSTSALKKMLEQLAEAQENQKAEEEAERARKAFEALSPEEQQQVLAQIAQQQQDNQAMNGLAQNPVDENGNPVDAAALQQPTETIATQPTEGEPATQPSDGGVVGAEGGKLNHKFDNGGKKNVGTWKNPDENHWDKYTRPGLEAFLSSLEEQLKGIPADDMRRTAIINGAINDFNALQQSYYNNILNGNNDGGYSDDVLRHQQMFDRMKGNTGFYTTDANGNVTNLISEGINLPNGAATEDIPNHWADGYNGPRTSIRNFGSTEYGDNAYYKDLADRFAKLGITYSPNENWKYGDNNSQELYALSLADAQPTETAPKRWDWGTGSWTDGSTTPITPTAQTETTPTGNDTKLPYKNENLRYVGLLGPALGLGLWSAGVGKPDTGLLNQAIDYAYRNSGAQADYKPIGNYLKYQPMDIWYGLNPLYASARATDRAITNNNSPIGTRMAAQLANGYNTTLSTGNLYRQGLEYNDALKQKVFDANRATDMFNAEAYNKAALTNAELKNRNAQFNAQMQMDAAKAKMDAQAQWYNALYGNIGELTKGVAGIGKDNMSWNQVAGLYNAGALGKYSPKEVRGLAGGHSKGGKLRRRKGLTF